VARAAFDGLSALTDLDLADQPVKLLTSAGAGTTAGVTAAAALCSLPALRRLQLSNAYLTSLDDLGMVAERTVCSRILPASTFSYEFGGIFQKEIH
jgi:hypothetical protein